LGRGILRLTITLPPLAGIPEELTRDIPLQIKRRGVEMRLAIESDRPAPSKADPTLLKEIVRAHRPLAFLAPEIVEAVVTGTQPADLTATKLVRRIDLALDWKAQKRQLGFE
jgi:site-specific DNA recombinase